MRGNHGREVGVLIARRTTGRIAVNESVLIPPVSREEVAGDSAVMGAGAIDVAQPVMGSEAGERGRRHRAHEPLQHAEVRLADAANSAVAPGLTTDPFDDVVEIL